MSDSSETSFYQAVGGEETFRRLVHAFYQGGEYAYRLIKVMSARR